MFIGPAGWNMDHDDGSTNYHDYSNLVFQGGYKYRDGTNRNMSNNLMISAMTKLNDRKTIVRPKIPLESIGNSIAMSRG